MPDYIRFDVPTTEKFYNFVLRLQGGSVYRFITPLCFETYRIITTLIILFVVLMTSSSLVQNIALRGALGWVLIGKICNVHMY
jgi:hypothetical protein